REVDEEVALEEDSGSDRGEGVVVNRLAFAFDREGDGGGVAVAFGRDHAADVDAGDPYRRVGGDIDPVAEGRVELVAVAGEGDVAGEGQVGPDGEDEDEDHRDHGVARPPLEAAVGRPYPRVSLRKPAHYSPASP